MHAIGLDDVDEIAGPRAARHCRSNLSDLWEKAGVMDAFRADLDERYASTPWIARPSPLPFELYPDVYVGRQAAAYLRAYERDEPWMCWVSFTGPHEPWDAPEPYASMYAPEEMPARLRPFVDEAKRARGVLDHRNRPAFARGDVARLRANYAGNITLIDDMVGQVLSVIEARGELDDTVIALVSDHGEMNGDHGLIYKENFLAASVRIPMLLRVPGARATVCDAPVELMDMGATLIELAGGEPLERSHAVSVTPVLDDPAHEVRAHAVSELRGETMIATREWKVAFNKKSKPYLVFDLASDPNETRNLAGVPRVKPVVKKMRRALEARLAATAS
jgi:choline-sulfatase